MSDHSLSVQPDVPCPLTQASAGQPPLCPDPTIPACPFGEGSHGS